MSMNAFRSLRPNSCSPFTPFACLTHIMIQHRSLTSQPASQPNPMIDRRYARAVRCNDKNRREFRAYLHSRPTTSSRDLAVAASPYRSAEASASPSSSSAGAAATPGNNPSAPVFRSACSRRWPIQPGPEQRRAAWPARSWALRIPRRRLAVVLLKRCRRW